MPLFGPPHGYGFGQLDDPPVDDKSAWSFLENIRRAIRQIFETYGLGAFNHIHGHMPAVPDQGIRAIYQRELVRRYNGGTEFRWNGHDWEIFPGLQKWADPHDHTRGANPRLLYPNLLGTNIVYSVGAGDHTVFPWPIAFTATNYGPGT
jgi:hypothetical protein